MSRLPPVADVARVAVLRRFWPPDKWERLATVARLAAGSGAVLDVGGRGSEMSWVLPGRAVTSLNVEPPADTVVAPGPLPFGDRSWPTVVSCDVLEHVPAEERAGFLAELVRVADRRVVLCFPAWSPAKEAAERRLAETLSSEYDVRFDFLDEHLEHGLPRVDDAVAAVGTACPDATITCWYDNDLGPGDQLLIDAVRARYRRDVRALGRVARRWVRRPDPTLEAAPTATLNRAYVVIDRPARG